MKAYKTIDEYIHLFPGDVQEILVKLRQLVKKEAPDSTEAISYGIPTFKLNGNLVHFAGYKTHIGFYPEAEAINVFEKELSGYETSKGTVRFPLGKPLPYDLITKIVKYRVKKSLGK